MPKADKAAAVTSTEATGQTAPRNCCLWQDGEENAIVVFLVALRPEFNWDRYNPSTGRFMLEICVLARPGVSEHQGLVTLRVTPRPADGSV